MSQGRNGIVMAMKNAEMAKKKPPCSSTCAARSNLEYFRDMLTIRKANANVIESDNV